jgi:hypothetical protein
MAARTNDFVLVWQTPLNDGTQTFHFFAGVFAFGVYRNKPVCAPGYSTYAAFQNINLWAARGGRFCFCGNAGGGRGGQSD